MGYVSRKSHKSEKSEPEGYAFVQNVRTKKCYIMPYRKAINLVSTEAGKPSDYRIIVVKPTFEEALGFVYKYGKGLTKICDEIHFDM